jgi:hypothetical protein
MKWFYLRVRRGTNVVCSATDMAKDHSPRLDEARPAEFNQSSELPEPPLVIACNPNIILIEMKPDLFAGMPDRRPGSSILNATTSHSSRSRSFN